MRVVQAPANHHDQAVEEEMEINKMNKINFTNKMNSQKLKRVRKDKDEIRGYGTSKHYS